MAITSVDETTATARKELATPARNGMMLHAEPFPPSISVLVPVSPTV